MAQFDIQGNLVNFFVKVREGGLIYGVSSSRVSNFLGGGGVGQRCKESNPRSPGVDISGILVKEGWWCVFVTEQGVQTF